METLSTERLRTVLDDADDAKAATRLVVALGSTDNVAVTTIADRYGIPNRRSTTGSIVSKTDRQRAPCGTNPSQGDHRRSRRSSEPRWKRGSRARDVGYDVEEWTAEHLDEQIYDTSDVEHFEAHIHRLFLK